MLNQEAVGRNYSYSVLRVLTRVSKWEKLSSEQLLVLFVLILKSSPLLNSKQTLRVSVTKQSFELFLNLPSESSDGSRRKASFITLMVTPHVYEKQYYSA